MEIILRKTKSSAIDENYSREYFVPLLVKNKKQFVVSFTANSHSSQYFNIQRKYDLDMILVDKIHFDVIVKKEIRFCAGETNFILVPSTYASNKEKISRYAKILYYEYMKFNFVHFTHFGFLQDTFPKEQIQKILDVFLLNKKINCEVCWDIDEKFFDEMRNLLKECLLQNNYDDKFNCYDEGDFKWNNID